MGDEAFCIRCHLSIAYDEQDPFCFDCMEVWEKYKKWYYKEHYCHRCGRSWRTSRSKPFCSACEKLAPPPQRIPKSKKTTAELEKETVQLKCPPHKWMIVDWEGDRKQERCQECGKLRED